MAFASAFRRILNGSSTNIRSQYSSIRLTSTLPTLTSPKLFISGYARAEIKKRMKMAREGSTSDLARASRARRAPQLRAQRRVPAARGRVLMRRRARAFLPVQHAVAQSCATASPSLRHPHLRERAPTRERAQEMERERASARRRASPSFGVEVRGRAWRATAHGLRAAVAHQCAVAHAESYAAHGPAEAQFSP